MGLDMYLTKKKYLGWNYEHVRDREGNKLPDLTPWGINAEAVTYIEEQAGYWRKENAIHNWFVKELANGNDDCKPIYLEKSDLCNLLKAVENELAIKAGNTELGNPGDYLPTGAGFFFGSTEYDDWYYKGLEYTKDLIENIVNDPDADDWEYYYRASW